ncbi:MAG: BspA family leucine-rich repeat surface protein, partial [Muribaculaceae bacterium]
NKTDVKMANPDTGYFTGETTPIITTVAPYAVSNEGTLTFYYDDQREQRSGTIYAVPDDDDIVPNWCNSEEKDTKYVFDASFKDYTPTTINKWFRENKVLATIEGLEYLNTSAVTDMSELFWWCHALTSLDLSSFDTSKVTDMSKMFYYCISLTSLDLTKFDTSNVTNMDYMFCGSNKLTTIYCNDTWSCGRSNDMFNGCLMLQGAVAYDANKTDVKMANPDTGYFTKIDASVSDINADESLTPPVIYNLQGIKMQTPQNSLPSGIYIVNGKKVLLRQ